MEYAIMSLKHMGLKTPSELTTAKEISQSKSIPFDVTSRVLQIMARYKVLESVQGVQGGYKLIQELNDLSLFQLIEMIEGQQTLVKCLSAKISAKKEDTCEFFNNCNIHQPLNYVNSKVLNFYKTISVSETVGLS